MADTDISSLLGMLGKQAPAILSMTPQMAQYQDQQSGDNQAMQWAQLKPGRGAVALAGMAGNRLGMLAGNYLGMQSPTQQMAQNVQGLKGMLDNSVPMPNVSADANGSYSPSDSATLSNYYQQKALTAQRLATQMGLPDVGKWYYDQNMGAAKDILANNHATLDNVNYGFKPIDAGRYTPDSISQVMGGFANNGKLDYSMLVNDPNQVGSAPERMNDFVSNVQYRMAHNLPVSLEDQQKAHNYGIYLTKIAPSQGHGFAQQGPEPLSPTGQAPAVTQQTSPESPEPSHPGTGLNYTPGTAPAQYTNTQVDALSKAYSPLSKFNSSLTTVEQLLQKYRNNPNGIPGFGRIDSAKPIQMLSGDALQMRQAVQTLHNLQILDQGGHTITDNELDRALTQLGSGKFVDPQALINGVVNTRQNFNQQRASVLHGFDDNTIAEFRRRGGFGSSSGNVSQNSSFSVPPAKMSNDQLKAALKKMGLGS